MLTKEIAQYLQANGIGTLDTDIFYEYLPPSPNAVVAIFSTGGEIASSVLGYDSPTIQIRVRAANPTIAYNKAMSVYNLLVGLTNVTLTNNGTYIVNCEALQSAPINIGKDEQSRIEYTQNYVFDIKNDTINRE